MTALRFDHLRSTRPRREPVRAVVVHWTGGAGANEAPAVYRTLRGTVGPKTPDGLSIHYVIEDDGKVVQMAAASLVCLHAGVANKFSIGIEVVSPGIPGKARDGEARRGIARDVYTDAIRGRDVTMLDYTIAQTDALTLLCERLCSEHKIARAVPLAPDGSLLRREMTDAELGSFNGVMGHYHCHERKLDCGTRPLERLRLRWGGKARH
jgi:N-acetyl-anhydromuramyl-L-alanine amidase AmpD